MQSNSTITREPVTLRKTIAGVTLTHVISIKRIDGERYPYRVDCSCGRHGGTRSIGAANSARGALDLIAYHERWIDKFRDAPEYCALICHA